MAFRTQITYPDQLIQSLAKRAGWMELAHYSDDERKRLAASSDPADKEKAKEMHQQAKDLIVASLDRFASGETALPAGAVILDDEHDLIFFERVSKEIPKGAEESPLENLRRRLNVKKSAEKIQLTIRQLAEETVRTVQAQGKHDYQIPDLIREALSMYCQRLITLSIDTRPKRERKPKPKNYDKLNLTHAIMLASLNGATKLPYKNPDTGVMEEYPVPAWGKEGNGNGLKPYNNQYDVITRAYVVKCAEMLPVNFKTNINFVQEWIEAQRIEGIVTKVKGAKKETEQ